MNHDFHAFSGQRLSDYLEERAQQAWSMIEQEKEDYLLQVNERDYLDHLLDRIRVPVPRFGFDDVYATESERKIPAESFPSGFNVYEGHSYTKPVLTVHIPYEGDLALLQRQPSTYLSWSAIIYTQGQDLCFDLVDFYGDAGRINQEIESHISNLRQSSDYLVRDIEAFNASLPTRLEQLFHARKEQILARRRLHGGLAVPVKARNSVATTFAIPVPPRRQVGIARPQVRDPQFAPEPMLDNVTYEGILRIIHEVGKSMERKPSTYAGKDEEGLRDHLLTYLESHYESIGSATGETFNKAGKTDILVRHENSNVFVAECKFWSGSKHYLATLDQLLSYLTWRDSKAAAIVFCRNKDFSSVLDTISNATQTHRNFLDGRGCQWDTRFDYVLHLPDDRNRPVQLAVLAFHFPDH